MPDSASPAASNTYEHDLLEYRLELVKASHAENQSFDRLVSLLASGGLGLTFTVVVNIAHVSDRTWLYLSWFGFSSCLLTTLLSMRFGDQAIRAMIKAIDAGKYATDPLNSPPTRRWHLATSLTNWAALATLVVAAVAFCIFLALNLR